MRGAIPPLSQYAFMAWCLVKHRDNFTFLPDPSRGPIQSNNLATARRDRLNHEVANIHLMWYDSEWYIVAIKSRRMGRAGHVARMGGMRNTKI